MLPRVVNVVVLGAVGLTMAAGSGLADTKSRLRREEPQQGVLFTGKSLPLPPQQGQPWKPPASKLPGKWLSAVEELHRQGFADPRGCEYREVKITCGSVWSNVGELVATHAWVMPKVPATKDDAQRFAVTWDGLVYPIVESGKAADLKADVEAVLKQGQEVEPQGGQRWRPLRQIGADNEEGLVSHSGLAPLTVCPLLLLGEGALAERAWVRVREPSKADDSSRREEGKSSDDPYLSLLSNFAWAQYDRAVCAHVRGDDVLSLLSAKAVVALEEAAAKTAPKRGFPQPQFGGAYLDLGGSAALLVDDEGRRLKSGPIKTVLEAGIDKFPDQRQRIAALVRDLEEVFAMKWGQPGAVFLSDSPIVKTLVKEGPAAVAPLLDCLAGDRRLTRAVDFHRDFFRGRHFLGVDQAAYCALQGIMKTGTFGPKTQGGYYGEADPDKRRQIMDEIRAFWEKTKGLSRSTRRLATLADPKATFSQWVEAAEDIVARVPPPGATVESQGPWVPAVDLSGRPLRGEDLRAKKNPSVAELMAQRADQVAQIAGICGQEMYQRAACELTLSLAEWDAKGSLPPIHRRLAECRYFLAYDPGHHGGALPYFDRLLVELAKTARKTGDAAITDDDLRLMSSAPAEALAHICARVLGRPGENPAPRDVGSLIPRAEMSAEAFQVLSRAVESYADDRLDAVALKARKAKNLAALEWMRKIPWPDFKRLELCRLTDATFEKHTVTAWCLPGNWEGCIVITPELLPVRVDAKHVGKAVACRYRDALPELLEAVDHWEDNNYWNPRWWNDSGSAVLAIREDYHFAWRGRLTLVHQAYAAASLGLGKEAAHLLHTALRENADCIDLACREWNRQGYRDGFMLLFSGNSRQQATARWKEVLRLCGDSQFAPTLREMLGELEQQAAEERQLLATETASPEKLSQQQQVDYYVARLSESSGWINLRENNRTDPGVGAQQIPIAPLLKIGRPAVPALIEHLEDRRVTRVIGGTLAYRSQDVALYLTERILQEQFYKPPKRLALFSEQPASARAKIIDKIKKWWKEHRREG